MKVPFLGGRRGVLRGGVSAGGIPLMTDWTIGADLTLESVVDIKGTLATAEVRSCSQQTVELQASPPLLPPPPHFSIRSPLALLPCPLAPLPDTLFLIFDP